MKYLVLLLCIVGAQTLTAQVAPATTPAATDNRKLTLDERFQNMKSKAESYQDYKVIKATTLDAEWKTIMDSIRANKSIWQEMRRTLAAKQAEIKSAETALQQKEASMAEVVHSSTHINFMGIDFSKSTFVTIMVMLIAVLAVGVLLLAGKLKMMNSSVREKADLAETTLREYEDYKQKALDKQAKLNRELQNERNKLSEMRHG